MELPDDASKSPKLPFLLGDAAFLGVATFLALTADASPSTSTIVGVIICTGIGVALGIAPFLLDYTRTQDQRLTERQNALEALVRTTSSASDQASIAANGLHEIAEITKRNLQVVEQLPDQIQKAKTVALASADGNQTAAIKAIQQAIAELRTAQPLQLDALLPEFTKIHRALESLKTDILAAPAAAATTEPSPTKSSSPDEPTAKADSAPPVPKPKKAALKSAAGVKAPPVVEPSLFEIDVSPEPTPLPPAKRTSSRSPAAPIAEQEKDKGTAVPPAAAESQPDVEDSTAGDEPPTAPADADDIVTRLTVTAYIGIGNRLFVRGTGPGLSPTEGTPLQFVSIGKWRWETDAATEPFTVTLWKNDQEECTAAGEIKVAPGAQIETSANF